MTPPYKYLDFYKKYNMGYWPAKIALLYNTYRNYDKIKNVLMLDISEPLDKEYITMLKIEIHFTYYQIIEALFEMIFALIDKDEKDLWKNISISGFENYDKIKKISIGEDDLLNKTIQIDKDMKIEIPFIRYVFFHYCNDTLLTENIENSLLNIKKLLKIFAYEFSNRDEYNAYKHSLRFILDKPFAAFKSIADNKLFKFESEEGFGYLVKKKEKGRIKIEEVVKSFNVEKDFAMCKYCSWMINNIIATRRAYYFNERQEVLLFHDIDVDSVFKDCGELMEVRFTKDNYDEV